MNFAYGDETKFGKFWIEIRDFASTYDNHFRHFHRGSQRDDRSVCSR
jgi:hypothetical protein